MSRRAKSYGDVYDAAREFVRKEREKATGATQETTKQQLQDEVDFEKWYSSVGQDLVDSSHEEYRYAFPGTSSGSVLN